MSDTILVHVTDGNGNTQTYEGLDGYSLMEVIRGHGLTIKAECGGCLCCATCAVDVSPEWLDKIPPQSADEQDLIDDAGMMRTPATRLSCQIVLHEGLSGIKATLKPCD